VGWGKNSDGSRLTLSGGEALANLLVCIVVACFGALVHFMFGIHIFTFGFHILMGLCLKYALYFYIVSLYIDTLV